MTKREKRQKNRDWRKQFADKATADREKRKLNLKEIELKHIETSLANRKTIPQPKQSSLKSVHEGLENTPSVEYVTKRKQTRTEAENLVESYLLRLNRQFVKEMPIKNDYSFYIIDFYIPKYKLCIEVDGGYHTDVVQQWRDKKRDEYLTKQGYKVMRFTNDEIMSCTFKQFKDTLVRYERFGK